MASASCETTAWECTFDYAAAGDVERIELQEIDCSLLTTLLEESHAEEGEHLSFSPHSATTASTTASDVDFSCGDHFEDCCLVDMLWDAQEEYCSTSASMDVDAAAFRWADMDVAITSSPSDDMADWFVGADEVGMIGFEDSEGYLLYSYCYDDVPVEDVYTPLWQ